ncbi:MAG: nucleotide sugar dehydrogenase [Planctomycetes bacterium]|nr:nucleotide sugar dehydrogenase [Planctomycetota bacterium]NUQ33943.1 nucleotide sugar dehydrogenase [Planctomycetaceae bacterium]
MNAKQAKLLDRFKKGDITVGVIGLGYVGLPLSLAFVDGGVPAIGFDIDDEKVKALANGESYLSTVKASLIKAAVKSKKFRATTDFSKLKDCDAVIVCVPTPLGEFREPDLKYIRITGEQIAKTLRTGQLVVLESTSYPGTTEDDLKNVLERSGLVCGMDFHLAFSPEREDPGNPDFTTSQIPKLVGGMDEYSSELALALYKHGFKRVIRVSHARVAEAAKLLENIYRAVNIALVNELKVVFEAMNIDIWEVIEAAATKPFGYQPFYPGPGLGGHCIPIDPFYLTWRARRYGMSTRFIELAGEINSAMPHHVVTRVQDALNQAGKSIKGAKILVLGVAYKAGVSDTRESPGVEIVDLLLGRGANVRYHDPLVKKLGAMRKYDLSLSNTPLDAKLLRSVDLVLMITNQPGTDLKLVAEHAPLILDTRNAFRDFPKAKVLKA